MGEEKKKKLTISPAADWPVGTNRIGQDMCLQLRAVDAKDLGLDDVVAVQRLAEAQHRVANVEVVGERKLPLHFVGTTQDEDVAGKLAMTCFFVRIIFLQVLAYLCKAKREAGQ